MPELVELSSSKHQALKLVPNSAIEYAATQHLLNIRVSEVNQAICNFPIFFSKNLNTGYWNLSAVTSFKMGHNLFVDNSQWSAVYQPSCIQVYPFYLMNSKHNEEQYTVGIDENNPAFSQNEGEVLFESNAQDSLFLSRIKALLKANIQNDIQTFQFGQALQELDLLKPINVIVQYQNEGPQTLTGLYTINEDKLHSLSDTQLGELNRRGYLTPIHAILLSIAQLNALIRKNNKTRAETQITSVKLELTKT